MSRLTINDLSFCETEIANASYVQGGANNGTGYISFFLDEGNDYETLSSYFKKNKIQYSYDKKKGVLKYEVSSKDRKSYASSEVGKIGVYGIYSTSQAISSK